MAISFINAATYTSGASATSSAAVPYPTLTANDILIAQVHIASSSATITTPAGWTLIRSDTGNNRRSSLYWKLATGSESGTVAFALSSGVNAVGGMASFRGVDTTTPIDASAAQTNSSASTSCACPTVTASASDGMLLTISSGVGNLTFTPNAGQTERYDVTTTAGSSNCASELATEALASSGATGTRASAMSGSVTSMGQSVILKLATPADPAPSIFFQPAQIAIFETPGGTPIADLSSYLTDATSDTDEHGCASTTITAALPLERASALMDQALGAHLVVSVGGGVRWTGRVEEPGFAVDADGATFTCTAYGYQQALDDLPYTALWSKSDYDGWYDWSDTPGQYTFDTNGGRLFLAVPNGTYTTGAGMIGRMRYDIPAGGSRNLTAITFDLAVYLPTNWVAQLYTYPGLTQLMNVVGNGALQTWTALSYTPNAGSVFFQVYNNTGSTATIASADNNKWYMRAINLSLKTAASVTPDAIVKDMLATVRATNSTQLSNVTSRIQVPGLTLPDESYIDANMRDVLDTLAGYGDSSSPPTRYAWRVWADQILRFEPIDTNSRTYTVSVGQYQADRALKQIYSQVYASYTDSSDIRQVISTATATTSTPPRVTRRLALNSQSTTSAQATQERDAAVSDQQNAKPRISIQIDRLTDASGARVPPYQVRAGDVLRLRDVLPTVRTDVDRLRSFRVLHTRMNWMTGMVDIDLESPQPQLDWLLARRGIGY